MSEYLEVVFIIVGLSAGIGVSLAIAAAACDPIAKYLHEKCRWFQ